jgi:hypothetical protein
MILMRGRRRFNTFDWQGIAASSGAACARRFEAAEQAAVWAARDGKPSNVPPQGSVSFAVVNFGMFG